MSRYIDMRAYSRGYLEQGKKLVKLSFGSCFNLLDSRSDMFRTIEKYDPQAFIWLGDFAYTDDMYLPGRFRPGSETYTRDRFDLT